MDTIDKPPHYTASAVEPIDAIEAWAESWPAESRYHLGNVVKYVSRCGLKGRPLEDLKKARWYLDRAIGRLEEPKPEPVAGADPWATPYGWSWHRSEEYGYWYLEHAARHTNILPQHEYATPDLQRLHALVVERNKEAVAEAEADPWAAPNGWIWNEGLNGQWALYNPNADPQWIFESRLYPRSPHHELHALVVSRNEEA